MSLRPVIENAEELESWIWTARLTPDEVTDLGRPKAEAAGASIVIVRGQMFSEHHETLTLDPDRIVVLSIGDEPRVIFMEISHEVADSFFNRHRGARRLYPETDQRQRQRRHQRERHEARQERQQERQQEQRERRDEHRNDQREHREEQRDRRHQQRSRHQQRNRHRSRNRSERSRQYSREDLQGAARYIEENAPRWGRTIERAVGPEFANRIEKEVRRAAKTALQRAEEHLERTERRRGRERDNRDYA